MMIDQVFKELPLAARSAGFEVKMKSQSHIQVVGGIAIVNVYGCKTGVTIHVQGTAKGRQVNSTREIIKAAKKFKRCGKARRKKSYKNVKWRKWNEGLKRYGKARCHWCKTEFGTIRDATADHVIPLSKGGSNGDDNIVLACDTCNSERGNRVTSDEIKTINKGSS